jgi:hypothetical protein
MSSKGLLSAVCLVALSVAQVASAQDVSLLASGVEGASGSAIGPGGALYVTEGATGSVLRVDPKTGDVTTYATGLPPSIVGIGGAIDIEFLGATAYVLVTLVGPDVGGSAVVGIYRIDGPTRFTVVADLGEFSIENPPDTAFDVPSGLQFALEAYRGGFLVTDGHHNRVLWATPAGDVAEFLQFDNIVPTGLAVSGDTIYMAEAGPVPHLPEDGKVVAIASNTRSVATLASGASLVVDVEFGRGRTLYALSQGEFPAGSPPAAPALPDTGALVEVNADGTFTVVVDRLDQPTSMEFVGNTAYVVTLGGDIWKIEDVSSPPFGTP